MTKTFSKTKDFIPWDVNWIREDQLSLLNSARNTVLLPISLRNQQNYTDCTTCVYSNRLIVKVKAWLDIVLAYDLLLSAVRLYWRRVYSFNEWKELWVVCDSGWKFLYVRCSHIRKSAVVNFYYGRASFTATTLLEASSRCTTASFQVVPHFGSGNFGELFWIGLRRAFLLYVSFCKGEGWAVLSTRASTWQPVHWRHHVAELS